MAKQTESSQWQTVIIWQTAFQRRLNGITTREFCMRKATRLQHLTQTLTQNNSQKIRYFRANDPSAGSPTETLLRLLLPLSDKVH